MVVSQLPGSRERLASRNPHILCQKYGGTCVCVCLTSSREGLPSRDTNRRAITPLNACDVIPPPDSAHQPRTSSECQRYEKQEETLDFHAAEKGAKKLVSSNFANTLNKKVATKKREVCEKT